MTERRRDISSRGPTARGPDGSAVGGLVKLFYRIGEVARIVGVAPHVLRYWETEFPTVKPQKSNHGQRVYTKRDVHKLLLIKHLLKEQGLTIAGARKQLRTQGAQLSQTELTSRDGEADVAGGSGGATVVGGANARTGAEQAELLGSDTGAVMGNTKADDSERTEGGIHAPGPSPKSLRQALLNVRSELVSWLPDLHG